MSRSVGTAVGVYRASRFARASRAARLRVPFVARFLGIGWLPEGFDSRFKKGKGRAARVANFQHLFEDAALRALSVVAALSAAVTAVAVVPGAANARMWGEAGHLIIGDAAAAALPAEMPDFFRAARGQLAYLNPEPDRWRDRREVAVDPALNDAQSIEHFIDLEAVPGNALNAPNRYAFLDSVHAHGGKGSGPGLLPYRILEMTQTLRIEFRLWRAATDPMVKKEIEDRIINDAGILGHYVADGSNPHHVTVNHDGWVQAENPKGFSSAKGFHSRFESAYVQSHMTGADVSPLIPKTSQVVAPLRDGIWSYLQASHSHLDRLYELDRIEPFGPQTQSAEHKRFTAERLAAGASMLRDLWWTAWVTSGS
jgi:hypothetical protein